MSTYLKPQSPLYHKTEDAYFYPLTTADQIIMEDGSRLDEQVAVNSLSIDLNEIVNGTASPTNADMLGNVPAEEYAKLSDLDDATSMELLWENASPTSNFSAQTINIPTLSNYKWLLIGCCYSAGQRLFWSHVRVGDNTIVVGHIHNNYLAPGYRYVDVSGNNINFSIGFIHENSTNYDTVCLPLYIYGIKEVSA